MSLKSLKKLAPGFYQTMRKSWIFLQPIHLHMVTTA